MGSRVIGRYSEPHKSWPRTDRSGDPLLLPYMPCGIHRHEAESLKIACIKGALWAERGKHYFSSSPRLELRAKYRVRLAWLLKPLLCRLPQRWTSLGPVQLRPRERKLKTARNYSLGVRALKSKHPSPLPFDTHPNPVPAAEALRLACVNGYMSCMLSCPLRADG